MKLLYDEIAKDMKDLWKMTNQLNTCWGLQPKQPAACLSLDAAPSPPSSLKRGTAPCTVAMRLNRRRWTSLRCSATLL
jgi:hypothetical protein